MNQYIIYFEFYGRKMKATIEAKSLDDAKQQVADRLVFHKIYLVPKSTKGDIKDFFSDIFGIKM